MVRLEDPRRAFTIGTHEMQVFLKFKLIQSYLVDIKVLWIVDYLEKYSILRILKSENFYLLWYCSGCSLKIQK